MQDRAKEQETRDELQRKLQDADAARRRLEKEKQEFEAEKKRLQEEREKEREKAAIKRQEANVRRLPLSPLIVYGIVYGKWLRPCSLLQPLP